MPASWTAPRICQLTISRPNYALLHEQLQGMISFLRRRRGWLSPSKVICWQRNDLQETSMGIVHDQNGNDTASYCFCH